MPSKATPALPAASSTAARSGSGSPGRAVAGRCSTRRAGGPGRDVEARRLRDPRTHAVAVAVHARKKRDSRSREAVDRGARRPGAVLDAHALACGERAARDPHREQAEVHRLRRERDARGLGRDDACSPAPRAASTCGVLQPQ